MTTSTIGRREHLTFKGNLRDTRYGWLRLTPAYSVHLVSELVDGAARGVRVLDPFCGTGTTALVCGERGIHCDTTDINPFLVWLAEAKTYAYDESDLVAFGAAANQVQAAITRESTSEWTPPIHQIEKWWDETTLHALGRAASEISHLSSSLSVKVIDLLQVSFCRVMIERANVSFGHQSMSFKKKSGNGMFPLLVSDRELMADGWRRSVTAVSAAAGQTRVSQQPRVFLRDARELTKALATNTYDLVVTSPPYPNRMSYIRELRPYMYWLGFLSDARQAGELDWTAIGGTWGCATSNLTKWSPPDSDVPFAEFAKILTAIGERSRLLSRYVEKYFHDMVSHSHELFDVVAPGGTIHYIVGNSKFYDVVLPVEQIYSAMFDSAGFIDIDVHVIRKRSSKKELFEYVVSARKPV